MHVSSSPGPVLDFGQSPGQVLAYGKLKSALIAKKRLHTDKLRQRSALQSPVLQQRAAVTVQWIA